MNYLHAAVVFVSHFLHKHFLWLLIAAYALAALLPDGGLVMREVSLGNVSFGQHKTTLSLPVMMLSFLLFSAGLGVKFDQLRALARRPLALVMGLLGNLLAPIAFIWALAYVMRRWHDPDEVQMLIVGLALVAAMPIAGSSTAWSQNANGDTALSLGLMLLSTFLSPFTTPFTFKLLERLTFEEYTDALFDLGTHGTGFLFWVLIPILAGIVGRRLIGDERYESAKPMLKLLTLANLLLLNYTNAAVSLPQMVAEPAWHFLALSLVIVVLLCLFAFASGWLVAAIFKFRRSQRIALMFGLGMSNNGTGLVLASMVLVEFPEAMLPLILYTLAQNLVAGCVDFYLNRKSRGLSRMMRTAPAGASRKALT